MNKLNHLAIIVDGNGRWAKKRGKRRSYGHLKGYENLKNIISVPLSEKYSVISDKAYSISLIVFM